VALPNVRVPCRSELPVYLRSQTVSHLGQLVTTRNAEEYSLLLSRGPGVADELEIAAVWVLCVYIAPSYALVPEVLLDFRLCALAEREKSVTPHLPGQLDAHC
jgi:hypothetical protein